MIDLTKLYADYLIALGGGDCTAWAAYREIVQQSQKFAGKERDPHRLYVTDVSKCRRAIAYRLLGAKRAPLSAAKRIMFRQSEDIEWHVAAACLFAGILEDYQFTVVIRDRKNWGGRGDIGLKGGTILEVKTMRSNAFQGSRGDDIPKPAHEAQVSVYHMYRCDTPDPILLYVDRGGANPPVQVEITPTASHVVRNWMDECDSVRSGVVNGGPLPDLPPMRLFRKAARESTINLGGFTINWSGEVWYGPDWNCSDAYCDFVDCPNKRVGGATMLCKMTQKKPLELTSAGTAMKDELLDYLASGAKEQSVQ